MKNQEQLKDLIDRARAEQSRGALKGHDTDADGASTNSWGPQMSV